MDLNRIFKCPKTGNNLEIDLQQSIVRVCDSEITYPIIDGMIDFCPDASDNISASYDAVAPKYDAFLTSSNVLTRLYNFIAWGIMNDADYVDAVISFFPETCHGVIADIPVGTGVFTHELYARFPNATIVVGDYSWGMLRQAKDRFDRQGITNAIFLRMDIAHLPLKDNVINLFLSMNGIHAFPHKQRAIDEIRRTVQLGGKLMACFYVKGVRMFSDLFVNAIYTRQGTFTPPFFELSEISSEFSGFRINKRGNVKSIVYFEAMKEQNQTLDHIR